MSTLGKRKERAGEADSQQEQVKPYGSTLFVSNLPFTATSTDLQTLFSDLAPVRSAFVVTERGSGVSKGVGYVSFAIKEDAKGAMETIEKEGLLLDGRKLRASWAESKYKTHDKDDSPEKKEKGKEKVKPFHVSRPVGGPNDPLAIRTIVISGLPSSIDSKTLWKKIRKYDGAETVTWPLKSDDGQEDPRGAHALFTTPAQAQEAVNKLHAHVFKGSLLSVTLKKRLEGLAKAASKRSSKGKLDAAQNSQTRGPMPTPSRSSRLIVRNLPFDVTEQDLRAVFLPYGPIYSIHVPQKDADQLHENPSSSKPKGKGFAFVWMLSKKDAEGALKGANGTKIQAGMAEKTAADKQKRKKLRREERKAGLAEAGKDGEEEGDEGKDEDERVGERVIAVDWALSKDRWEEEKAKTLEQGQEGREDDEESSASNSDSSSDESDSESESEGNENLGVHEGDEDSSSEVGDEDDEDVDTDEERKNGEKMKPQLPPPETGTTLFIRNVPYEATEDELRTLFRPFGPLRYARITIDPASGRSRGTGFACFWNRDDADKVIEQSEILRAETGVNKAMEEAPKKANPFKFSSILTPDPSSSMARSLVLHGRTLDVVRAVTRDAAYKLKELGERQREKADKRNLYLLREGIILPNTPAADSLNATEVEKRAASFNARKKLLQSNPSLYVSKTRLSIRQIPLFVTERALKRLGLHAIRAFEAEVKEGSREGLSEHELLDLGANEENGGAEHRTKGKRGKKERVKQAKIVRQADRVDAIMGKGRSRGYGFLELNSHADALRVLRWANNNPEVGKLFGDWWKEELERMMKAAQQSRGKEKTKREGEKDEEEGEKGRVERLKKELEKEWKNRGTLIVEFSIENVQVVQRRKARTEEKPSVAAHERSTKRPSLDTESNKGEERSPKKRRLSHSGGKEKEDGKKPRAKNDADDDSAANKTPHKTPNPAGTIIGRKRKQKRLAKSGKK